MAFVYGGPICSSTTVPVLTPRCSLERVRQAIAPSAVALVLSAALLSPIEAIAQDTPVIHDHDQSLVGADFSNRTDLRGSIFSKSNCKEATFAGSDLTNAQLDDANVRCPGPLQHAPKDDDLCRFQHNLHLLFELTHTCYSP